MLNRPGFLATVTFFGRTWSGSPLRKGGGFAPANNGCRQVRQASVIWNVSPISRRQGAPGRNLAAALGMTPRVLNQAAGRRIDDGSNASGLRRERVPGRHRLLQRLEDADGDAIDTADTGHLPDLRRARVAGC